MQITIEPTDDLYDLDSMIVRKWVGTTDKGIGVLVWVALIQPQTADPVALLDFEDELNERRVDVIEVAGRA